MTAPLRSQPAPNCHLCGTLGRELYQDLTDRLYSAPGTWRLSQCANSDCGLVWLDPQPVEADIGNAYRTYFTHPTKPGFKRRAVHYVKTGYLALRYGYSAGAVNAVQKACGLLACLDPFRRAGLDVLVHHLSSLPRGRLLDVGCGDGQIVEFMNGLGWQAEGVDFDPAAVAVARHKGLQVQAGKLQALAFPANSFAAIVMSHFIEHVHEPLAILQECHRLLRPNGRLIILTPNVASWGHRRFARAWFALDPPRHLHLFTLASLQALVVRSGLTIHSATTSHRNIGTIMLGSCAIQRTGRFERSRSQPLPWQLRSAALQIAAWLAWKSDATLGEELDLVANK